MFNIKTYVTSSGKDEIADYIELLAEKSKTSKSERIKLNKIMQYLSFLECFGTAVGQPVTKHISCEIWELRPLKDRIFYAYVENETFILLHYFTKKTQKTPKKEIEQAERNLKDWKLQNKKR